MSSCCTGYGGTDTHAFILNDGRQNPHSNAGHPYPTITIQQVYDMLAAPPSVAKENAQWIIPSNYHQEDARSHEAQRTRGSYYWLAADIDQGNPTREQVIHATKQVLGSGIAFLVYASRGSTLENKKWRTLVPLSLAIPGSWYSDYADAFFDGLEHFELTLDRTLARAGQLIYLPNRGEHYEWYVEDGACFDSSTHPQLTKRATEYNALRSQIQQSQGTGKSGPFISQYAGKHQIADLLKKYNFTQKGGSTHWSSPYSTSGGFGFQDRGDHWISLSHSDAEAGLGKATVNGSRYGDAFDLYTHFEYGGNFENAVKAIKAAIYGDASSGVLVNYTDPDTGEFWDIYPSPQRKPGNGYDIVQAILAQQAKHRAQAEADREHEIKQARALADAASAAELHKWGGDWTREVPFEFKPSELEWLAWHAPGAIGMAVRARAPKTARFTLVPLMVGATMAVSHLGQGKFVSRFRQHHTPSALMMFQVGDSGTGKGDGNSIFYDLMGLVDRSRIKAYRTKTFASGQSLTDYLMHHNSDVMMIQQEGGADRKAGKGNGNFESLISGVTEAYTAFEHGIEITHTKSDEKEAKSVAHPSVSALMSSTPKKLFSSIEASDSESGWLGRNLFIPLPLTNTNMEADAEVSYPAELAQILNWMVETIPPVPGQPHPDVWQGQMQGFHLIRYTPEAMLAMDEMTRFCDSITNDIRRGSTETAIYARATEAVNRLATVAALAKGGLTIDAECVTWSTMLVKRSLHLVTSKMENMVEDEIGDTPSSKVRGAVKKYYPKAEADSKFYNSFGTGIRRGLDDDIQITFGRLKRKLKDNTKMSARIIDEELKGMIEDEEIVMIQATGMKQWLRYLG